MIGTTSTLSVDESARLRAAPAASWGAILAGAVVAIAVSLVLVTLGSGLGFGAVSPWRDHWISTTGFTIGGTIWLIVTQWVSAGIGGYIAGRLRQRWLATHTHELFFRDTAHGLVVWSFATLVVAAVLVNSAGSLIGVGAHSLTGVAAPGVQGSVLTSRMSGGPMKEIESAGDQNGAYDVEKLFRSTAPAGTDAGLHRNDLHIEALHIAAISLVNGNVSDEDRAYLTNVVASNTGIPTEEAQKRVNDFIQNIQDTTIKAKIAADETRKSAATAAVYTALSLMIGAFIASVAAVIGGRLRDEHL